MSQNGRTTELFSHNVFVSHQTNLKVPKVSAIDQLVIIAKTQTGELLFEKQIRGDAMLGTIVLDYPGI